MSFWRTVQPWVFNGMGGFVISAVTAQFEIYRISIEQRAVLMDRCNIMAEAYHEVKAWEDKNKGK